MAVIEYIMLTHQCFSCDNRTGNVMGIFGSSSARAELGTDMRWVFSIGI